MLINGTARVQIFAQEKTAILAEETVTLTGFEVEIKLAP